jgi:hypothetical protein
LPNIAEPKAPLNKKSTAEIELMSKDVCQQK